MNKKCMFSSSLVFLVVVTLLLAFAVNTDGSETTTRSQVTSSDGNGSDVGQGGRLRTVKSPKRRLGEDVSKGINSKSTRALRAASSRVGG